PARPGAFGVRDSADALDVVRVALRARRVLLARVEELAAELALEQLGRLLLRRGKRERRAIRASLTVRRSIGRDPHEASTTTNRGAAKPARGSLADDLDQHALPAPAVELAVEDLLPRSEVELPRGDRHHDLATHHLALQ